MPREAAVDELLQQMLQQINAFQGNGPQGEDARTAADIAEAVAQHNNLNRLAPSVPPAVGSPAPVQPSAVREVTPQPPQPLAEKFPVGGLFTPKPLSEIGISPPQKAPPEILRMGPGLIGAMTGINALSGLTSTVLNNASAERRQNERLDFERDWRNRRMQTGYNPEYQLGPQPRFSRY